MGIRRPKREEMGWKLGTGRGPGSTQVGGSWGRPSAWVAGSAHRAGHGMDAGGEEPAGGQGPRRQAKPGSPVCDLRPSGFCPGTLCGASSGTESPGHCAGAIGDPRDTVREHCAGAIGSWVFPRETQSSLA